MSDQRSTESQQVVDETTLIQNASSEPVRDHDLEEDATLIVSASGSQGSTVLPEVYNEGNRIVFRSRAKARYQHDMLLGRGGMGEVRLAYDQDIGRRVAVKRLLDEKNPHALARFIDEIRTVGSLEHPNIVPIHDVGVDANGSLFFVMKFVEGETLASIIKHLSEGVEEYHRRFPFEARLNLFTGLLRALQYAHNLGLLHRDIKPENIMVGRFGEVVLMDWGVARRARNELDLRAPAADFTLERAANETQDGTIMGTPRYMSPEQAAGETSEIDCRSDLYSAFIVLYELLTTCSYMETDLTTMESVFAARNRQPPKIHDPAFDSPHQPAVPADLRHFLRRGLAPAKEDRFADANEVIQQLERIRSGDCCMQCPLTFVKASNTRFERFMDSHPLVGIFAICIAAAACVTGLVAWGMWLTPLLLIFN